MITELFPKLTFFTQSVNMECIHRLVLQGLSH